MSHEMSLDGNNADLELGQMPLSPNPRLNGYPSFANFIAADADAAIYRKYERLSARHLLYLQSELHELEGQLEELDFKDVKDGDTVGPEAKKLARLWPHFSQGNSEKALQHRKLQNSIGHKLKAYRNCPLICIQATPDSFYCR